MSFLQGGSRNLFIQIMCFWLNQECKKLILESSREVCMNGVVVGAVYKGSAFSKCKREFIILGLINSATFNLSSKKAN